MIDSNDDKQIYSIVQRAIEILNDENVPHDKKETDVQQLLEYLK